MVRRAALEVLVQVAVAVGIATPQGRQPLAVLVARAALEK